MERDRKKEEEGSHLQFSPSSSSSFPSSTYCTVAARCSQASPPLPRLIENDPFRHVLLVVGRSLLGARRGELLLHGRRRRSKDFYDLVRGRSSTWFDATKDKRRRRKEKRRRGEEAAEGFDNDPNGSRKERRKLVSNLKCLKSLSRNNWGKTAMLRSPTA